ncbi:hypothetical protein BDZ89DRAFT_638692 [Hymenopellis radicata]|nr:hypothetical protein BDZ89DRAFT_765063 [Hymenopellis radicata]KAF9003147.1 hypothetical protein BDZ89DRAFT_638692 [Hymenopellis radicata]
MTPHANSNHNVRPIRNLMAIGSVHGSAPHYSFGRGTNGKYFYQSSPRSRPVTSGLLHVVVALAGTYPSGSADYSCGHVENGEFSSASRERRVPAREICGRSVDGVEHVRFGAGSALCGEISADSSYNIELDTMYSLLDFFGYRQRHKNSALYALDEFG